MSKSVKERTKRKSKSIYSKNMLTRKIVLPFTSIGGNLNEILKEKLEEELYNKCCKEGYIKKDSIIISSYSSGIIQENNVNFDVFKSNEYIFGLSLEPKTKYFVSLLTLYFTICGPFKAVFNVCGLHIDMV